MITYMTRHLVAQRAMTYAGQDLEPGDSFYATPDDERYFTRNGSARPAGPPVAAPRQFVPAAAPIGETSTLVPVLVLEATNAGADTPSVPAAQDTAAQPAADTPSGDQVAKTEPSAVTRPEPSAAATPERPAPATRARTRLLTSAGEASN